MLVLSRLIGATANVSRTRHERRPFRRRRAQVGVESLEGRDLKSSIPGVSNLGGVIQIQATQTDHNTASVSIDPNNGNVQVSLNGISVEFCPNAVWTITYTGGQGGWDTFTNDTDLTEYATGYGGNNQFLGGSSYNTVLLWGDYNSYDAQGGPSNVFTYNGPNDDITPYSDVSVYSYNVIVWW
jgi:hypothetical protein